MFEEGPDIAKWLPQPLQSGLWINIICNHSKRKNKTLVKKGNCFQAPTTVQSSNYVIHVCLQPNLLGQFPFAITSFVLPIKVPTQMPTSPTSLGVLGEVSLHKSQVALKTPGAFI